MQRANRGNCLQPHDPIPPFSIRRVTAAVLVFTLPLCGCKPSDRTAAESVQFSKPFATPSPDQLQELRTVTDNAWARLVEGDADAFLKLLHPGWINERVLNEVKPERKLRRAYKKELLAAWPQAQDRLLQGFSIWRDSYWRSRTPVYTDSGMDVEIELYSDQLGLNFLHLICARTKDKWVIVDFYTDSDATPYSKRAAKIIGSLIAGKTDEGDVHRLKRIQDFWLNNDYKSIRTAFPKLPESIKNDRATLMLASNAAAMLEDRDWADRIRQRYIGQYGKDTTLLLFDLDYYSGIGDWKKVSEICKELNEQKNGSGPLLYIKAIAESAGEDVAQSVETAMQGIRTAPDFLGNWIQAIAGHCELQQFEKATQLAMKTVTQFDDMEFLWSDPVFPGFVESAAFQKWQATLESENDKASGDG